MEMRLKSLAGAIALAASSTLVNAAITTVDSVGTLDPNPNALTVVDSAGNTSLVGNGVPLATFQTLVSTAYTANLGGVIDFQEQFQGGTFPNNPANSPNNGVTLGSLAANALAVTYGTAQSNSMSFFRNNTSADGFDAAVNQGGSVISGGPSTRNGSGTANYDFTTSPPVATTAAAGGNVVAVGGGYMGIAGAANAEFDFNNGLSAFGLTAVPRGASRHSQFTLTLSDNSTIVGTNDLVTTSAVFYGFQLTPAQLASGLTITKVTLTQPDGTNRFDDLAFVVAATPEPASLSLLGLGALAMVRRRRH